MKSPDDKTQLLRNVDAFLRGKFIYESEAIETLLTPDYMLSGLEISGRLVGDCDDISTLHASIITVLGLPVRFVAIRSIKEDLNFDHVYIEANDGKEWIMYDVTIPLGATIEYFARLAVQV